MRRSRPRETLRREVDVMHPFRSLPSLLLALLTVALAGCGGGGVDDVLDLFDPPDVDTASFIHRTTAANRPGTDTYLDHPYANGNPNAVLIVTPHFNPWGDPGVFNLHFVGVRYDHGRSQWAVVNLDGAAPILDAAFNVTVAEGELSGPTDMIIHGTHGGNTFGARSYIDHDAANGKPGARIFLTQNLSPYGAGNAPADIPVAVGYDTGHARWYIERQLGGNMPHGVAFNLAIVDGVGGGPISVAAGIRAQGPNIHSNRVEVGIPASRNAIHHVTPAVNLGGAPDHHYDRRFGIWYDESNARWEVFNQNFFLVMDPGTTFMVGIATP